MRTASPARRAAGFLAVTTIGLSTAVLSVTGVASAAIEGDFTFSTRSTDDATVTVGADGVLEIPAGYCSVAWTVVGAQGGAGSDGTAGKSGGSVYETVEITGAQTYRLSPGTAGTDAAPESAEGEDDGTAGLGGENAVGDDGSDGVGFGSGMGYAYSGGGGAGSRVELLVDSTPESFLFAYGGDGTYADSDGDAAAGNGAGDEENTYPDGSSDSSTGSELGDGHISGEVTECESTTPPGDGGSPVTPPVDEEEEQVTGAPIAKWVDGVVHGLDFQLTVSTVHDLEPVTAVEYSLDGGLTWTEVDAENEGDYQYEGTITGLQTGRSYSVSFRFMTPAGPTRPSEALTGAPILPAPTGVAAATGPSSIKVDWQALTGESGVTGYTAWALPEEDQQFGNEPPACETNSASALSCVIGVPAGAKYRVVVMARDTQLGDWSDPVLTDVVKGVAISATLPTSNGALSSSDTDGKVVAGEQVTISGTGFLPGSTVELVVYSTPVKLGTTVVLADGTFSATVTLPKELANGVHHLVATGVDVNGAVRNLVVEVTVSGGTAVVSGGLAYTGFSPAPFLGAGALALLAGGGMLVASRRRQA